MAAAGNTSSTIENLSCQHYHKLSDAVLHLTNAMKDDDDDVIDNLWKQNDMLHSELDAYKDGISRHFRSKKWDRFKKHCNEHELIFTSTPEFPSISAMNPISRSFFKLWEAMHDFGESFFVNEKRKLRAVFLAEGPGGFVEAFAKRRSSEPLLDELFGMTLMSANRNVPEWKISSRLNLQNFKMITGTDGTGDLYNVHNIDMLVNHVGVGKADVVTADGGFDFSGNYNLQEKLSLRLIASEVYTALQLQAPNGTFFLKVYDLRLMPTLMILSIIIKCYGSVILMKPMSSRPANSEKYLLCTNYIGCPENILRVLRLCVQSGDFDVLLSSLDMHPPSRAAMSELIRANTHFIQRQIDNIDTTLNFIRKYEAANEAQRMDMMNQKANMQISKSHEWCLRYMTGISDVARKLYGLIL